MTNLTITDLSITEELDRKAMAAIRGGMYKGGYGFGYVQSYGGTKLDFDFTASQLTSQVQNNSNQTGNNVAFANNINSTFKPNQSSTSTISF